MENKKTTRTIILVAIIIFLLSIFTNFFLVNKINNMDKKFDQYENAMTALNDSLSVKIDGQTAIWSKLTPEINIDDLVNSEYFKSLSEEQKEYYKELQKVKGLIASTKAELSKHGTLLEDLNQSQYVELSKDSIKFIRGHEMAFKESDTSKNLQWDAIVKLDSITNFKFNYKYDVDIQTDFIRNKDKSIMVQYKINDPDLIMNKNHSFIIPTEQKTKWKTFIDNNKWLKPVGAVILFGAGGYVGYQIAK